jgi:hypothetical protein
MWPATAEEYDRINEWRKGDDRRSELNALLSPHVEHHVACGAVDKSNSLGILRMPDGYALMLNADYTHYYWLRYDSEESVIYWNKWDVYRLAMYDSDKER